MEHDSIPSILIIALSFLGIRHDSRFPLADTKSLANVGKEINPERKKEKGAFSLCVYVLCACQMFNGYENSSFQ